MTTPGYSGTPLVRKLGLKPSGRVCVIGAPDGYEDWLHPLPDGLVFEPQAHAQTDLVHLFTTDKAELAQRLSDLRQRLNPAAALWVSWPKKASKLPTDITEDTIRELGLPLGWVDIKVCAVSDVWSGLKLVVRKTLR